MMEADIKILAIETSGEACSAALYVMQDDGVNVTPLMFNRVDPTPRQHAKLILSMLDEVLEEGGVELKEVDAIAFGRGPGAFTGLRIAAGVAQGVALSIDKPVIPVSTLSALAVQAVDILMKVDGDYNNKVIAVAIDARMSEVYWGFFQLNKSYGLEPLSEEKVTSPDVMFNKFSEFTDRKIICIGSGWDVYEEELFKAGRPENVLHMKSAQANAEEISILGFDLLNEGKTVAPEDAQPIYLRNDVAKKSQKQ